jgi:DNA-binding MarR family transcriptional regulator
MSRPTPPVRTSGPLPPPLAESRAFSLMQAGRIALELATDALAPLEMTVAEFAALAVVEWLGKVSQTALAERLGMSQPTLLDVVKPLRRDGLLDRWMGIYDCRRRELTISDAGAELLRVAAAALEEVDRSLEEAGRSLNGRDGIALGRPVARLGFGQREPAGDL